MRLLYLCHLAGLGIDALDLLPFVPALSASGNGPDAWDGATSVSSLLLLIGALMVWKGNFGSFTRRDETHWQRQYQTPDSGSRRSNGTCVVGATLRLRVNGLLLPRPICQARSMAACSGENSDRTWGNLFREVTILQHRLSTSNTTGHRLAMRK